MGCSIDDIKSDLKGRFDDLIIAPSNEDDGVADIIESLLIKRLGIHTR